MKAFRHARLAIAEGVLSLPRQAKIVIAIVTDMLAALAALLFVRYLVHPEAISVLNGHITLAMIAAAVAAGIGCWVAGAYRTVTRFVDGRLLMRTLPGAIVSAAAIAAVCALYGILSQTWNIAAVHALVAALFLCAWRVVGAQILTGGSAAAMRGERVIIYGAGAGGRQLAHVLKNGDRYAPIAFIDDAPDLQGRLVHGLRVYSIAALERLKASGAQRVLLAMPSVSRVRRQQLLQELERAAMKVMVMPGYEELADGSKRVDELREVQVEDLLGREPVQADVELMRAFTADQVVMITGGGGSIGSELARQVLRQQARKLVLFDASEYALYEIERELKAMQEKAGLDAMPARIIPVLGSVLDEALVARVIQEHAVDTIYHAAAYKHVPMVEANPIAGVCNNLFGTRCVVEAAARCEVPHFVLVSTDKAVRPTNVMGASKRISELVVQHVAASHPNMRVAIVRFGNVLASSGSVIPLFRKQLAQGGPITVTHPDVTRYFMTIPEAAELVIQAGAMGRHGEIFLLEMGEPVKIVTLAERLIHLSGMELYDPKTNTGDIEIKFVGMRPGEKMIEELLVDGSSSPTRHPRIFLALDSCPSQDAVNALVEQISQAVASGQGTLVTSLVLSFAQCEAGNGGEPAPLDFDALDPVRRQKVVPLHKSQTQKPV